MTCKTLLRRFLPFALIAPFAFATEPACLDLRHYYRDSGAKRSKATFASRQHYWVDFDNKCGADIGDVYVVVSFWDARKRHLANSLWTLRQGEPPRGTYRFLAPGTGRNYASISTLIVTRDLREAIVVGDLHDCPSDFGKTNNRGTAWGWSIFCSRIATAPLSDTAAVENRRAPSATCAWETE